MKTGVVLQLFSAALCSFLGAWLWCGEARSESQERGAGDSGRDLATSGRSAGSASSAAPRSAHSLPASRDSGGSEDPTSSEKSPSSDGSGAERDRSGAPSAARHRPRAASSSIATIPPVVGPEAPHIPESFARVVLRFVGKDPAADALWKEAIDDLSLSKEARSDLIEDLNDEGYPDPDHLTAADLPLILRRIEIIERLAPHAIDDVNAAAFAEAYKDLLDMLVSLRAGASGRK